MMGYGSGTGGTPRGGCTGMLIENNIFSDLGSSIILESEVEALWPITIQETRVHLQDGPIIKSMILLVIIAYTV